MTAEDHPKTCEFTDEFRTSLEVLRRPFWYVSERNQKFG